MHHTFGLYFGIPVCTSREEREGGRERGERRCSAHTTNRRRLVICFHTFAARASCASSSSCRDLSALIGRCFLFFFFSFLPLSPLCFFFFSGPWPRSILSSPLASLLRRCSFLEKFRGHRLRVCLRASPGAKIAGSSLLSAPRFLLYLFLFFAPSYI